MRIRYPILIGVAIAVAMGLSLVWVRSETQSETSQPAAVLAAGMVETMTYFAPKVDGVNLDVRLMGHMRANPARTAERFCRDNGFSTVADLTTRTSTTTRTIADGAVHESPGRTNQAFAMIRCGTQPAPVVIAS